MEKYITVIAGRAGSGKSRYVEDEIGKTIDDPNKIVVLIDHKPPQKYMHLPDVSGDVTSIFGQRDILHEMLPRNLMYFDYAHAGEAIGKVADMAAKAIPVTLYYDHNGYPMPTYIRDMLVAAGFAGADVIVTTQAYNQVDGGDESWLRKHCYTSVITKHRAPRKATEEEIKEVYR